MTGFNSKWSGTSGTIPEFGAIFMSSASTKKECLTRQLFGLPSSQASFVKQIKDGMILFLFEFEKRELHGVFRASCDGALNIVPHAFSSSGKQFSAQVKFNQIWHCKPLSEREFRGAIKDNYFSSKKFNFGLCRDQVHKLLLLFNSRKLNQIPERQSTRSNVKRYIRHSPGKPRRSVDDCRLLARDRAEVERDSEKYDKPFYFGDTFDEVEGVSDGGLARKNGGGYCHDSCVEPLLVQSNQYQGNCLRNFERVDDDDWTAATDRVQKPGQFMLAAYPQGTLSKAPNVAGASRFGTSDDELRSGCNVEKEIMEQGISTDCFSTISSSGCSSNPNFNRENTFKDQRMSPSTIFCPMQSQFSNHSHLNYGEGAIARNPLSYHSIEPLYPTLSYSTSRQDASVTNSKIEQPFPILVDANTVSYDPEDPGFDIGVLSSYAARHSSGSAQECAPHDSCGNIFPPVKSQSFSTDMEPNTSFKNHERSCWRNKVPLSLASVPEKTSLQFSENDAYIGFSFPKPSSGTMLYSENGNSGVDDKEYSSYSVNPSCKDKSLMFVNFGYGYPATLHDIYEKKTEVPLRENRKVLVAPVPFSHDDECRKPDCTQFAELRCVDYHEHVSMNSGFTNSLDSQNMRSHSQKKRSVFSRLSLAPQEYGMQHSAFDNDERDMDMSVDEVMMTLPWARARKSKSVIKEFNKVETNRKRQKISSPKGERSCLKNVLKDTVMSDTSTEEKRTEDTPFLDFKCRSQVQKNNEETESRGCVESIDNGSSSGWLHKRRKLIRPNFSKIVSSADESRCCVESIDNGSSSGWLHKRRKLIRPNFSKIVSSADELANNDDSAQNLQSSVIEEIRVNLESLGDTEVNENMCSHHVELPHKVCLIGCEDNNYHMEAVGLNCEVERKAGSCEGSINKEVKMKHHRKALACKVCPVQPPEEIQQQNADIEIPRFEPECGESTHKGLLQEAENSNKPCSTNGKISTGGMMIKSANLNMDTENIPERVSNDCVNEESKEKSVCRSLSSNNEQCRASDESVRRFLVEDIFQETYDNNIRDVEVLKTGNGDGDCTMTIVQKVENRNDALLPIQMTSLKNEAVLSTMSPDASDGIEVTEASQKKVGDEEIVQTASEV